MSCECKCRFDEKKGNSDQWWNKDKCLCEYKKGHGCEEDYTCNPATCSCQNGKCLGSIIEDSAITCDKIIDALKKRTMKKQKHFQQILTKKM